MSDMPPKPASNTRVSPPPPAGFVHVDLDGLWTLAGCYRYPELSSFAHDPIFAHALPRLLDLFDQQGIQATFFIVGRDLEVPAKREAIAAIAERGHELANHSYHHPIGLESLPYGEILEEVGRTQQALMDLTGTRPVGFRSPGYDAGPNVWRACAELGLRYEGSTLPTRFAPILRHLAGRIRRNVSSGLTLAESELLQKEGRARKIPEAPGQYGRGAGGPNALMPQRIRVEGGEGGGDGRAGRPIVSFPLAVSPVFRFPLHASLGMILGLPSVTAGLQNLARRGWPITYLLHGMDALAPEEFGDLVPRVLSRGRGFQAPLDGKLRFLRGILTEFSRLTNVTRTDHYLEATDPTGGVLGHRDSDSGPIKAETNGYSLASSAPPPGQPATGAPTAESP